MRPASRRVSACDGILEGPSAGYVPSPLRSPYVLVVDDDLGIRETFDWALRASGIRVRTSASGRDAIATSKGDCFDLLLVDLDEGVKTGTVDPVAVTYFRYVRDEGAAELLVRLIERGGFDPWLGHAVAHQGRPQDAVPLEKFSERISRTDRDLASYALSLAKRLRDQDPVIDEWCAE